MYTFLYNVFISNAIKMQETSIGFGMVHSATTVVVMLHKHYSTFCNSVNIIMNYMYANMSESNSVALCQQFIHFFQVGLLHVISLHY